jgi:hypothetical protein
MVLGPHVILVDEIKVRLFAELMNGFLAKRDDSLIAHIILCEAFHYINSDNAKGTLSVTVNGNGTDVIGCAVALLPAVLDLEELSLNLRTVTSLYGYKKFSYFN